MCWSEKAIPTLIASVTSRPVERDRRLDGGHHAAGDLDRVQLALGVAQQDRELVAAEPRGRVDRAHAVGQAPGDHLEDLVAGGVAEAVVDVLEVVEVEEQHRHRPLVAAAPDERVLDAVAEQRAVRQPGERVVEGLVLEFVLEGLALGDVAHVQHDPLDGLVAEQVAGGRLDVAPAALLAGAARGTRSATADRRAGRRARRSARAGGARPRGARRRSARRRQSLRGRARACRRPSR